jgi:uncharacterized damage-inducible protein DinB
MVMDTAERAALIEKLRASRDALVEELAGVSESQAKFKPAPDRWSIEEIVEHLAVAEHGLYRLITAYSEPIESPADSKREETFERLGTDRRRKLAAPERARPTGRYGSLSNALEQFTANRERTILYVDSCQDDLRMRITTHLLGRITCRECLALMIGHPLQHLEQIKEVRASPGYPS